jgi:hypothetical protein
MRAQHHRKPRHPRPLGPPDGLLARNVDPEADDGLVPFQPRPPRRLPHDPGRVTRDTTENSRIRGWRASDMPETPRDRLGLSRHTSNEVRQSGG